MMPSFISLFSLFIAVMVAGKYFRGRRGTIAIIVIAALIQTAVTLFDFYTMEVPTP
jgi:heme/copper-type cytochrome/quinol oxidase subunit 4